MVSKPKKSDVLYSKPGQPLQDFCPECYVQFSAVYEATRQSGLNLVQWHKKQLGPQDFVWMGSGNRRNYVWERSGWRVFVHNGRGISIEITGRPSVAQAKKALAEYLLVTLGA